jgi:hypothetical protein
MFSFKNITLSLQGASASDFDRTFRNQFGEPVDHRRFGYTTFAEMIRGLGNDVEMKTEGAKTYFRAAIRHRQRWQDEKGRTEMKLERKQTLRGRLHLRFGCAVWMCVSLLKAFSMSFSVLKTQK